MRLAPTKFLRTSTSPRRERRDEWPVKRMDQHWDREYVWQSPLEALDGSTVLLNAPLGTRHIPSLPFVRTEIIEQVGKRFMDAGCHPASTAVFPAELVAAVGASGSGERRLERTDWRE
jgi:hypothetical protein